MSPHRLRDSRLTRWDYVRINGFEFALGILAILTTIVYFWPSLAPPGTVIGNVLGGWDSVYFVAYGCGGALVCYGLIRPMPRLEQAGLCFMSSAVSVFVIASAYTVGWPAWQIELIDTLFVAVMVDRARTIRRSLKSESP